MSARCPTCGHGTSGCNAGEEIKSLSDQINALTTDLLNSDRKVAALESEVTRLAHMIKGARMILEGTAIKQ